MSGGTQKQRGTNHNVPKRVHIPNDIKVLGSAGAHIAAKIREHIHKLNSGGYRGN